MSANNFAIQSSELDDWSQFHRRLGWARKQARLTQNQVCALVGMSQGAYSLLEKKGTASEKTSSLAKVLGVNAIWLETGEGQPGKPISVEQSDDYVNVSLASLKLSAGVTGFGIEYAPDELQEPIMFKESWLKSRGFHAKKLIAIKVKGHSMEPGLNDGDTVIINVADTQPKDGEVFAFNLDGEPIIKRLARDNDAWWLDSDNPDKARYPRKFCSSSSLIIGRIVHKQSERI